MFKNIINMAFINKKAAELSVTLIATAATGRWNVPIIPFVRNKSQDFFDTGLLNVYTVNKIKVFLQLM